MSNEMTAEQYYQKIKNDIEIITPVHCKHYGSLRAKEAVKEFAEELMKVVPSISSTHSITKVIINLAKQKGVEI